MLTKPSYPIDFISPYTSKGYKMYLTCLENILFSKKSFLISFFANNDNLMHHSDGYMYALKVPYTAYVILPTYVVRYAVSLLKDWRLKLLLCCMLKSVKIPSLPSKVPTFPISRPTRFTISNQPTRFINSNRPTWFSNRKQFYLINLMPRNSYPLKLSNFFIRLFFEIPFHVLQVYLNVINY